MALPGAAPTHSSADFVHKEAEFSQRSSFSHWQLKDLLCCAEDPDVVYFADGTTVKSLHARTAAVATHLELPYPPTAFTVGCGYLCAVGPDSDMTVKSLETGEQLFAGRIGTTISNSCLIRRHGPGDLRLMVCQNEERVKVYALPSVALLADVPVKTQVNYCDVSPDHRLLVAVGDSNFVFVYTVRGQQYTLQRDFKAFDDCAFSCCFSPDGWHFIAAAQDGRLVLMQVRDGSLQPALTLYGFRLRCSPPANKYCRAIKYHPTPGIDLVAFTESTSYIHILDVWAPENHQVVRVAPDNEETDICGLCFSPDGATLYVALQDRLVRLSVDVAGRRCHPLGKLM
eukprot:EG_transcript_13584